MIYEYIYIYMVQFLESSKEGLLKNRRPSNNRISLKNRTVFFCRPGMSLKKYSFLRTSCPELFKENSQEDVFTVFYGQNLAKTVVFTQFSACCKMYFCQAKRTKTP